MALNEPATTTQLNTYTPHTQQQQQLEQLQHSRRPEAFISQRKMKSISKSTMSAASHL